MQKKQIPAEKSITENCIGLLCVCVYNISSLERESYELPLLIISPSPQGISNFRLQRYVLWGWASEMELVSHITKKQNKTEINVMIGRNGFLNTFTAKLFTLQSGNFFEY